jgi:hypothetical protein
MKGITLGSVSQINPTLLTHNEWKHETISVGTQVDWYQFTATAATTYYLQWDDWNNGNGAGKTLTASVSACHGDGTPVFTNLGDGYAHPQPISARMGEPVYVRIKSTGGWSTGTYAVRYYSLAGQPPQSAPYAVYTTGLPVPAGVITWYTISGATGYEVLRASSEGGPYTSIETTTSEYNNAYTDTTVAANATYWYKVRAVNGNGPGPDSAAVRVTIPSSVPPSLTYNTWTPGTLSAATQNDLYRVTAGSAGTYVLQWDDAWNSAGGYTSRIWGSVFRADGTPEFTAYNNGYTYPESFLLSAGETVYVKVEPANDTGSNTGTYAIRYYNAAAVAPQTAPAYVWAQGTPGPTCVAGWDPVTGATGYKVYRSTTGTFSSTPLTTLSSEYATSYTDTAVTAGTTYYYKVSAENGIGEGPQSPAVSDTPPAAGTGTLLTLNTWTIGNVSVETQVDWYRITIGTAGTYSLQWDDRYEGSGTYTGDIMVSAYQADGTSLFIMDSGYNSPPSKSFNAGETLYVRVVPYGNNSGYTGTYRIKYYQ